MQDAQLHTNVTDELLFEPSLDASDVTVNVHGGIVTLSGSVPSYPEKWAAETAVKRVRGVQGVAEGLAVNFMGAAPRSDTDIAGAARRALEWSALVPEQDLQVQVEKGWITLDGQVDWQTQRQAAHDLVAHLLGVKGVSNMITLRPHVKTTDIHTLIEAAFRRSGELDARQVQVDVSGGTVTLRGALPTWMEIGAAGLAAWNAPGVSAVDNQITIQA